MASTAAGAGETQQDSIPKVIHYCWFGMKPHPAFVVKCMDSWRRVLPDYRIVEWNETNTDLDANAYVREAYDAGKYAFVTDYVRLKVLHEHGGIYMDTDVEVVRSLDAFLHHDAFSGFEHETSVPTAVMGSRAHNQWIAELLAEYGSLHFILPGGDYDLTSNVSRITATTKEVFGVRMDNSFQDLARLVTFYPREVFCPKSYATGVITRTPNTHAIHHFAGSWRSEGHRQRKMAQARLNNLLGVRLGGWLLAVRDTYDAEGALGVARRVVDRVKWWQPGPALATTLGPGTRKRTVVEYPVAPLIEGDAKDAIPKVIHYCWFGGRPHSSLMVRCMDTWRQLLPDYRIIEWNETNFDVDAHTYTREAYAAGKYAFVSDYARLQALLEAGGVYLDTDTEVVRRLDPLLGNAAFSGFEEGNHIQAGAMGSVPDHEWIRAILESYEGVHYLRGDGTQDEATIVTRISRISTERFGVRLDGSLQILPGFLTVYPVEYLCPMNYGTGVIKRTPNTHTIHHYAASWRTDEARRRKELQGRVNRLFGVRLGSVILSVRHIFITEGPSAVARRAVGRVSRRIRGE